MHFSVMEGVNDITGLIFHEGHDALSVAGCKRVYVGNET